MNMNTEKQVLDRAMKTFEKDTDRLSLAMDLEYANVDLEKLMSFKPADFIHDIMGILRYMDRRTGKLKDCFVPRSVKTTAEEI